MKSTERFNLQNVGTFQSLTSTELYNLCRFELHLPDMPPILFIKTGLSIKNGSALLKPELQNRLRNALIRSKN